MIVLDGEGANQAAGLAQFGMHVALLGVVGDDEVGDRVLDKARTDGIDISRVVRHADPPTGLIVDVVDAKRHWHYREDLPTDVFSMSTAITVRRRL